MKKNKLKFIGKEIPKIDSYAILHGYPIYTDDIAPKDSLIVSLYGSPYPHAIIKNIDVSIAKNVDGIEDIFTYKDINQNGKRYTIAGQTYPEPSPHDRLLLDKHLRYVGDAVAIIVGKNKNAIEIAKKLIKVEYEILEPIFDYKKTINNKIVIHNEDNWEMLCPVGGDNKKNLVASQGFVNGDVEKAFKESEVIIEKTYHTKANQQQHLETFRAFSKIDEYGNILIVSSTQIPFHVKRIVSIALGINESKIRVIKPRVGGGFGAKQSAVVEPYVAFATYKTKKTCKIVFDRTENSNYQSPRNEAEMIVKIGATKKGKIKVIDLYTIFNTGAYSEHGPTTVELTARKSIPLYNTEANRFQSDVVYTNINPAGAFRGYGAPQGIFAVESAINELAFELKIDPIKLREMNINKEGDFVPAYYDSYNTSSTLDKCIEKVKMMSKWEEYEKNNYSIKLNDNKIKAVGFSIAMQGSSIPYCDKGGATIGVKQDGTFSLILGCTDIGTGCDTILLQMCAEILQCELYDITVSSADTLISPYDSGSYASSTTYLTGNAVIKTANELIKRIIDFTAKVYNLDANNIIYFNKKLYYSKNKKVENNIFYEEPTNDFEKICDTKELAIKMQSYNDSNLEVSYSIGSTSSPPPYMASVAEIILDKDTGEVFVDNFYSCIDCGTVINKNLAKIQAEGGIVQGIGMALMENINYDNGKIYENNMMLYKIPTRLDFGKIHVEFIESYEESGPFGAKSIGELVIDTACPSINHAIFNAINKFHYELPMLPETNVSL